MTTAQLIDMQRRIAGRRRPNPARNPAQPAGFAGFPRLYRPGEPGALPAGPPSAFSPQSFRFGAAPPAPLTGGGDTTASELADERRRKADAERAAKFGTLREQVYSPADTQQMREQAVARLTTGRADRLRALRQRFSGTGAEGAMAAAEDDLNRQLAREIESATTGVNLEALGRNADYGLQRRRQLASEDLDERRIDLERDRTNLSWLTELLGAETTRRGQDTTRDVALGGQNVDLLTALLGADTARGGQEVQREGNRLSYDADVGRQGVAREGQQLQRESDRERAALGWLQSLVQQRTAERGQDTDLEQARLNAGVAQRGQDVGFANSAADRDLAAWQSELSSGVQTRGQDLQQLLAELEARTTQRGQDTALSQARLSAEVAQRGQDFGLTGEREARNLAYLQAVIAAMTQRDELETRLQLGDLDANVGQRRDDLGFLSATRDQTLRALLQGRDQDATYNLGRRSGDLTEQEQLLRYGTADNELRYREAELIARLLLGELDANVGQRRDDIGYLEALFGRGERGLDRALSLALSAQRLI